VFNAQDHYDTYVIRGDMGGFTDNSCTGNSDLG